jgi:putative endonuclease
MHYVYILKSEIDSELYIGCTNNLKKRLSTHNSKKVASTSKRVPFHLIYYEVYLDSKDAFAKEQFLKTGWGRNYIKRNLTHYFNRQKV